VEGKERPARRAHDLTAIFELIVSKMWEARRLTTLCAPTVFYSYSFTLHFTVHRTCVLINSSKCSVRTDYMYKASGRGQRLHGLLVALFVTNGCTRMDE
jgi:hypothetical protein